MKIFFKKPIVLIISTALATVFLTLLISNLGTDGKILSYRLEPLYTFEDNRYRQTIGNLLGPPMLDGNSIESFENGDQIFPAMLEAIASAKKTITLETFVYWSGNVGERFAKLLSKQAQAGVEVSVMLDAVGSGNLDEALIKKMTHAGVVVKRFRPLKWYNLSKMNNRTHRKLLIIDGVVGFTGGVGIADKWDGHAQSKDHWRDSHFKITGPVVPQLQAAFLENWNTLVKTIPHGNKYFPVQQKTGSAIAQAFKSSPYGGSLTVRLMYIVAIELARKNIRISTAYFVPDDHIIQLLVDAAQRGVKIEIILPGPVIDVESVRKASRSLWGPLLQAGVEIYEFQPTMYHSKIMVVDDIWVSVGSTNFDNRSFRLNAESNLNILDKQFAAQRSEIFDMDKAQSKLVTYEAWKNRSFYQKVEDKFSGLLRSQY